MAGDTVTVQIDGGPTITVPWVAGMNAQQALEAAWNQTHSTDKFTYALQYFGSGLGYLVFMINETYDTFMSTAQPYFYWDFLLNGTPSGTGIDNTVLHAGDVVEFRFDRYDAGKHGGTLLETKHTIRTALAKQA